jgi:hypothetical protein
VGRAKPPPLAPATDPYEPMYDDVVYVYGPPGVERRHRRSGMTVALVVVGVFAACCVTGAVAAMFGGAMFRAAAEQASAPPATRSAAPPTTRPARTRSGLGAPVRDGQFEFVVKSVSCGHKEVGEKFVSVKATGQFCIVSLTVKNIGDEGQTFADSFQKAHGADDKIYRAHTGAGVIANEGTNAVWNSINPGLSMTGKIVFDIPKKAALASLELHDSPLSRGATVTIR